MEMKETRLRIIILWCSCYASMLTRIFFTFFQPASAYQNLLVYQVSKNSALLATISIKKICIFPPCSYQNLLIQEKFMRYPPCLLNRACSRNRNTRVTQCQRVEYDTALGFQKVNMRVEIMMEIRKIRDHQERSKDKYNGFKDCWCFFGM